MLFVQNCVFPKRVTLRQYVPNCQKKQMTITLCRGPLAQQEWDNAIFCAPDNDVPWSASGLKDLPRLSHVRDGSHTLIYLEGHRAEDAVWHVLESLSCDVVIQGDPLALRPRGCNLIAEKLLTVPDFPWFTPSLDYFASLDECINQCKGDWRILAPDRASANMACAKLRGSPNSVRRGDLVFDFKHKQLGRVAEPERVTVGHKASSARVLLDNGRYVNANSLNSYLVQTVANFGSGECDVLVVLPNVSDNFGAMALRRVRHKVIGLGWHPAVYI